MNNTLSQSFDGLILRSTSCILHSYSTATARQCTLVAWGGGGVNQHNRVAAVVLIEFRVSGSGFRVKPQTSSTFANACRPASAGQVTRMTVRDTNIHVIPGSDPESISKSLNSDPGFRIITPKT